MVLKDWNDIPYGVRDCLRNHIQYNNMVTCIRNKAYEYIVYEDDGTYYALNGITGNIDSSNVDATTVIQYAFDNLTAARTHKETVAFRGAFVIESAIDIPSYTILDFKGSSLTLKDSAGFHMLQIGDGTTGVTDVDIMNGVFDGNRTNQAALKHCIYAQDKCERINIHHNYFTGWYGKGVYVEGGAAPNQCYWISVCDNTMDDFQPGVDSDGVDFDQVTWGNISRNLIRDVGDECIDAGAVTDVTIMGNVLRGGLNGIELYAFKGTVQGNTISAMTNYGISLHNCRSSTFTGNYIYSTSRHGIWARQIYLCTITANAFWRSSSVANNTWDDIHLESSGGNHSTHNTIIGNTSAADGVNKVKYMVQEADANQDWNIIKNNINVGAVTGNVLVQGVNTIAGDNI